MSNLQFCFMLRTHHFRQFLLIGLRVLWVNGWSLYIGHPLNIWRGKQDCTVLQKEAMKSHNMGTSYLFLPESASSIIFRTSYYITSSIWIQGKTETICSYLHYKVSLMTKAASWPSRRKIWEPTVPSFIAHIPIIDSKVSHGENKFWKPPKKPL